MVLVHVPNFLPEAGLDIFETPNPDAATPPPVFEKLLVAKPPLGDPNPDEEDPLPKAGLVSVYT